MQTTSAAMLVSFMGSIHYERTFLYGLNVNFCTGAGAINYVLLCNFVCPTLILNIYL